MGDRYLYQLKNSNSGQKEVLLKELRKNQPADITNAFIGSGQNPVIIGFAETATALGHAFFQAFQKADYFHTTRENLQDKPSLINFEEEHSHATSHRCYIEDYMLDNDREVILVDDEITTGKTVLNIIRSIHEKFPRKQYTVVSLLDWRSEAHEQQFAQLEAELDISVPFISLFKGRIAISGSAPLLEEEPAYRVSDKGMPKINHIVLGDIFPELFHEVSASSLGLDEAVCSIPYIQETGRFGINAGEQARTQENLRIAAQYLKQMHTAGKALVLGTGEFMYIPMKLAALMGDDVFYQSTTRSPIYPYMDQAYAVQHKLSFPNPEDEQVAHFVYNIPADEYDDIFVFFERQVDEGKLQPMIAELTKTGANTIHFIYFNGGIEK